MQTILFICTANYFRSRYAEWFFNHHAEAMELPWRAVSRGLLASRVSEDSVSPHVLTRLEAEGIRPPEPIPERMQLKDHEFRLFDRAILMDREEHLPLMYEYFPRWYDQVEYWDVPDVDCCPPMNCLAHLEQKVHALLDELQQAA